MQDYTVKHHIVSTAYSQLSTMISSSIDDEFISDDEFSAMVRLYDSTISKLENNFNNWKQQNNFNNNNVRDIGATIITSADCREHHSDENNHDINSINEF